MAPPPPASMPSQWVAVANLPSGIVAVRCNLDDVGRVVSYTLVVDEPFGAEPRDFV